MMLLGSSISAGRAVRHSLRPADARLAAVRVVVLASAISAGIHAALAPGHFEEGSGAGAGFPSPPCCSAPSPWP